MALTIPGPSAAAIATARIRPGKAKKTSVILIITSSTTPPRYAAGNPLMSPRAKDVNIIARETPASIGAP